MQDLLLAWIRRVVLAIHADALEGVVVLARDDEEHGVVVGPWFLHGELKCDEKTLGAAGIAWHVTHFAGSELPV